MPLYCYRTEDGETVERLFSVRDRPARIVLDDGRTAKRAFGKETPARVTIANWPLCSDSAGVNPVQRFEAMEHARSIGIPTEFNGEGQAVFTSPQHRKRYCEAIGMFDRNAGHNDPLPGGQRADDGSQEDVGSVPYDDY